MSTLLLATWLAVGGRTIGYIMGFDAHARDAEESELGWADAALAELRDLPEAAAR